MKTIQVYVCEICGVEYREEQAARDCEAQGVPQLSVEVGDIVLATSGFTWCDGDRRWIENPDVKLKSNGAQCPGGDSNCFDTCRTYQFYYVVTAIDLDPDDGHRARYHLATKAMSAAYRDGFTFDKGHYAPRKVSDPPKDVIRSSKNLIGLTTERLL